MLNWFNEFPFSNKTTFNLDYLLDEWNKVKEEWKVFKNIEKIKFAKPIWWDKSSRYQKNTIVVYRPEPKGPIYKSGGHPPNGFYPPGQDENGWTIDGSSFLSLKEVPPGIDITNEEYWFQVGYMNGLIAECIDMTMGTIYQMKQLAENFDALRSEFGGIRDSVNINTAEINKLRTAVDKNTKGVADNKKAIENGAGQAEIDKIKEELAVIKDMMKSVGVETILQSNLR